MNLGLQGKSAVVAASSGGIGYSTALGFAREGARVTINGRSAESLSKAAAGIRNETGARVLEVVGDVSKPDDCRRLVEQAVEHFGGVDALVTNAGGPPSRHFEDLKPDEWDSAYRLTLGSVISLIGFALPHLRRSKGAVATVSSYIVKQPDPVMTLSNTFRSGVVALLKTLSEDLAGEGIRFNNVGPGLIMTERQRELTQAQSDREGISFEEALAGRQKTVPMGRFGTAEDVANMLVFLCSPASGYTTGQTILVDGGLSRSL